MMELLDSISFLCYALWIINKCELIMKYIIKWNLHARVNWNHSAEAQIHIWIQIIKNQYLVKWSTISLWIHNKMEGLQSFSAYPSYREPRSSMIPDSTSDEYPSYRSFLNHYFSKGQMTYMASTTWNG